MVPLSFHAELKSTVQQQNCASQSAYNRYLRTNFAKLCSTSCKKTCAGITIRGHCACPCHLQRKYRGKGKGQGQNNLFCRRKLHFFCVDIRLLHANYALNEKILPSKHLTTFWEKNWKIKFNIISLIMFSLV